MLTYLLAVALVVVVHELRRARIDRDNLWSALVDIERAELARLPEVDL